MSSIADEILKLHQLQQQGILSAEEFDEAKRAVISRNGAPPAQQQKPVIATGTSSLALGGGGSSFAFNASSSPDDGDCYTANGIGGGDVAGEFDTSDFPESHTNAHEPAYRHLQAILQNISNAPDEQRFRRLRFENARLARELFNNPGAVPFLISVGFQVERDPSSSGFVGATIGSSDGAGPKGDSILLPGTFIDTAKLQRAVAAIERLRARDTRAAGSAQQYTKFRRSLGLEIRLEKLRKVMDAGEARGLVTSLFLEDVAGDGLATAAASLDVVERVLANIANAPQEPKFRVLRFSNRTVYSLVVNQGGALELLVGVAGFVLTENEGLHVPPSIPHETILEARSFVAEVRAAVKEGQVKLEEDFRRSAEEAAKEGHRRTVLERRRKEERRKRAEEEAARAAAGGGSGRRVPIAEAIEYLLHGGKRREDDEEE